MKVRGIYKIAPPAGFKHVALEVVDARHRRAVLVASRPERNSVGAVASATRSCATRSRPAAEAVIDRLTALKSGFNRVPVLDGGLALAPAQQHNLVVETASITNFDFSPEFNKAIEAKQVAQQEAEKQKYVLQQADLQRQTEVTRAEGKAQAAKLTAESLKANGGALVIAREWIEKWDGKLPNVSAGGAGGGSFMIDLSSLMKEEAKKK